VGRMPPLSLGDWLALGLRGALPEAEGEGGAERVGSGEVDPTMEREVSPVGTGTPLSAAEELEEGDALAAREMRAVTEDEGEGGCEGGADIELRGEEVAEGEALPGCDKAPSEVPIWAADVARVAAAGAVGATLPLPSPGEADCTSESVPLKELRGDAVS
jgi:hypothetical protein